MKSNIVVPALGESVMEARIAHWLKKEGDKIEVGDAVVELETEKVNVDVTAEIAGVLTKIMAHEEDTVHIGDAMGEIDGQATNGDERKVKGEETAQRQEVEANEAVEEHDKMRKYEGHKQEVEDQGSTTRASERATPVAKKVAEETGLKLSEVLGSGTGGRVTKHDVESFLESKKTEGTEREIETRKQAAGEGGNGKREIVRASHKPTIAEKGGHEERAKLSLRRKTIARRMLEAQQTTAMLTTFNEIDMSHAMEIRKKYKEQFKKKYGIGLGIVSFFVKASIAALKEFPRLNAEIDGDEIVYKHYYDIGIAIGAEEGLVVPVLRNADAMSFAEIEAGIKSFADRSQSGTLTLEDLRGGTFTITNGGVFGSLMSTPILNPPQVGILGLHKIAERPVAENGQIVVKPMMYVALTYDHRIVDGRESVQFLVKVRELVEDPAAMLLE